MSQALKFQNAPTPQSWTRPCSFMENGSGVDSVGDLSFSPSVLLIYKVVEAECVVCDGR